MTNYYRDNDGNYLGGFDGVEPPIGAIEVPYPPMHALQKWVTSAWVTPNPVKIEELKLQLEEMERQLLIPRGVREAFIALCKQQGAAAGLTDPQLYVANPFYKNLKDSDTIAAGLRAQITALK